MAKITLYLIDVIDAGVRLFKIIYLTIFAPIVNMLTMQVIKQTILQVTIEAKRRIAMDGAAKLIYQDIEGNLGIWPADEIDKLNLPSVCLISIIRFEAGHIITESLQ